MIGTETPGGRVPPPLGLPPGLNPCTKCGREPRKPGQRWGKACHAAYMRRRREQQRQAVSNWRAEVKLLIDGIRDAIEG